MAFSAGAFARGKGGLYKVEYYETGSFGSGGAYSTGGVPVTVSRFVRLTAFLAPAFMSGGYHLEVASIATNQATLIMRTSSLSGDVAAQAANATATSGVLKLQGLAIGE